MVHPPIDELLKQVPSKYALVIIASKLARQINAYHHQLGEGEFDEGVVEPDLLESVVDAAEGLLRLEAAGEVLLRDVDGEEEGSDAALLRAYEMKVCYCTKSRRFGEPVPGLVTTPEVAEATRLSRTWAGV